MAKKRSVTEMVAYVFVRNCAITPKRAQSEIKAAFGKEVKVQTVARRLRELRNETRGLGIVVTDPFRKNPRSAEPTLTFVDRLAIFSICAVLATCAFIIVSNHV